MKPVKNKVLLTGAVSRDPQVKQFGNGKKWASLSLMIADHYADTKGVNRNNTQWHPLKAFGKIAEQMEKDCKKGTKLFIQGKLVSSTYTDKEGKKKYVTEVEVIEMTVLEDAEPMSHLE
ncbi:MAG: single-stranded DNA-binding protein [Chitinophagaceae bacterium]